MSLFSPLINELIQSDAIVNSQKMYYNRATATNPKQNHPIAQLDKRLERGLIAYELSNSNGYRTDEQGRTFL